jgi:hypothetical protein
MKLTHFVLIFGVPLFISCAATTEHAGGNEPAGPDKYTPFSDVPIGISILNSATLKYASEAAGSEPCVYNNVYLSIVNKKAYSAYNYNFTVWVPKGKKCRRNAEEFIAIAPQCGTPNLPSSPAPHVFYRTVLTTNQIPDWQRNVYPADASFTRELACPVNFIEN